MANEFKCCVCLSERAPGVHNQVEFTECLLPLLMATLPWQESEKQLAGRPPAVFQPCPGPLQGALQGGGERQGGAGGVTTYSRRHKTGGINTLLLWRSKT